MSGDIFVCPNGGRGDTDIYWVGATDTPKHHTIHRIAPTRNYMSQMSIPQAEKPWIMLMYSDTESFSGKFLSGISRSTYIIIAIGQIFNNL